jgi:hypothetical protein
MTREPALVGWPVARDDAGVAEEIERPMIEAQVPDPMPDAEVQQPEPTSDAEPESVEATAAAEGELADPAAPADEFAEPEAAEDLTTGHAEIDTALRRLDELDGLPVEQHGEVYDELHGQLRNALTAAAMPAPESSDD